MEPRAVKLAPGPRLFPHTAHLSAHPALSSPCPTGLQLDEKEAFSRFLGNFSSIKKKLASEGAGRQTRKKKKTNKKTNTTRLKLNFNTIPLNYLCHSGQVTLCVLPASVFSPENPRSR